MKPEDILDLTWYSGRDLYCDGPVEDTLLSLVSSGEDMETILQNNHDWPILYHLSDLRENLLEWIPMKKDATLLEIGAGCGAVTGLFCRKAASVTAVDLSKKRSTINAIRHGEAGNLKILVGNFQEIEITETFDYVTLIGVLEYSVSYLKGEEDPFLAMLVRAKKLLKPGGTLLLAIENKFGMKYFAGAGEDHTAIPFDGICGYPDGAGVRTFSRKELAALLEKAGFSSQEFYYPMPDYKLPTVIYSDEYLPTPGDFAKETEAFDRPRDAFFDENKAFAEVTADGRFPEFANSFLVLAKAEEGTV